MRLSKRRCMKYSTTSSALAPAKIKSSGRRTCGAREPGPPPHRDPNHVAQPHQAHQNVRAMQPSDGKEGRAEGGPDAQTFGKEGRPLQRLPPQEQRAQHEYPRQMPEQARLARRANGPQGPDDEGAGEAEDECV